MIYKFADGSRIKGDPNAIGKVCEKLDGKGKLTAANLLDEARSEESPLHGCFEWDDSKAAELYRLDQARYIIRSIVAVEDFEPTTYRAFAHTGESVFMATKRALGKDETRKIILATAKSELEAFERKYRTLEELAEVMTAIRGFIAN